MNYYKNLSGRSGISGYDIGEDKITVYFKNGSVYIYTNSSAGSKNVSQMKILAKNGNGLNSFINTTVRELYEKKII